MPVTITKTDGYRVSTPGGVKAKHTTARKAMAQKRLLNAVEHSNWKPTGKPSNLKHVAMARRASKKA